jgi:hypothetical protein
MSEQTLCELPPGVTDTFTHLCKQCGDTISVTAGIEAPHRCRIVVATP